MWERPPSRSAALRRSRDSLEHTIRDVGPVTHSLCGARVGDVVGVRGPFGSDWGLGDAGVATGPAGSFAANRSTASGDVVVVAGGIGLAPLRGAVNELVERARRGKRSGLRDRGSP